MPDYIKTEWFLYTKKADFQAVSNRFGIDPVTARILRNRDLLTEEEIGRFLHGGIRDLYDGSLLPDARAAAESLVEDIKNHRKIRVVGDYDIDGVCAAYILVDGLRKAGAEVSCTIPDRVKDGYGINRTIVTAAAKDGISTIVTCDNGISAIEELREAKELGMKVVVTDHHDIRLSEDGTEILPDADFIINAKLKKSEYKESEICGAVTAWKLLELVFRLLGIGKEEWLGYLEFAGIATIGDVMKLQGENRIIAREFLLQINEKGACNAGLSALIAECGLFGKKITAYHVGYVIGPCINAAGRLETAEKALRLFLCKDPAGCARMAAELKEMNDSRKAMTQKGQEEAVEQVLSCGRPENVLCVVLPGLHESMAGIVAGRLREIFGKPSFVFTRSGEPGVFKGSGRSVEAYNMFAALDREKDLLVKYGGHPMAAGISVREEDLPALAKRLNDHAGLTAADLVKRIMIDVPMPMSYVTESLIRDFSLLEPYGNGNDPPVFAEKDVVPCNMKVVGKNRNALRLTLRTGDGFLADAIMFGEADRILSELLERKSIHVIYSPEINEYNGRKSIQFRIEAYK